MSGVSGTGGAGGADRLAAFEDRLIYGSGPGDVAATTSDSERGVKVTKREMAKAVGALRGGRPLDAQTRADVWKSMSRLLLTGGAKDVLESVIGPPPRPAIPGTPSGRLARSFERLAKDLYYTSESDYPYAAFHRKMDPRTPLTPATFKLTMGLPPGHHVRFDSAEDFFRDRQNADFEPDAADRRKYAALEAAMKRGLTDLKLIYGAGDDVVEAPVYLVGRARDGSLVGLESTRIWT